MEFVVRLQFGQLVHCTVVKWLVSLSKESQTGGRTFSGQDEAQNGVGRRRPGGCCNGQRVRAKPHDRGRRGSRTQGEAGERQRRASFHTRPLRGWAQRKGGRQCACVCAASARAHADAMIGRAMTSGTTQHMLTPVVKRADEHGPGRQRHSPRRVLFALRRRRQVGRSHHTSALAADCCIYLKLLAQRGASFHGHTGTAGGRKCGRVGQDWGGTHGPCCRCTTRPQTRTQAWT